MDKELTLLQLNFYKSSGKWFGEGIAKTNHEIYEDGFKQDIIDTQDAWADNWVDRDLYVHVENADDDRSHRFCNQLFMPGDFKL